MKIGLTYNLKKDHVLKPGQPEDIYAEFDSEETIEALTGVLESLGHEVFPIGGAREVFPFLSQNRVNMVFNIAEGLNSRSREAQVPAILEALNIPYTFSDPLTLALTLDKAMTKRVLIAEGIPTPDFIEVSGLHELRENNFRSPLFIKPVHEGTAKGICADSIIDGFEKLKNGVNRLLSLYKQPVLVEQYLSGNEYTVAVLGNGSGARVLGMMGIVVKDPEQKSIYTQKAKEQYQNMVTYIPGSKIDTALKKDMEEISLKAYHLLGCRDAARIDFRCDEMGQPHFLEINPLPGLHPIHSDLPIIARQVGMSYRELISTVLAAAMERYRK